ncbi:MAG: septal ring lytic transglycosylase RlpA family protein [Spirochaetia bacterium]|jgi:rare lipoprotein A|nr:septal ring lytic transglycosylase RlpA family protein [Spirochaetia bacterium]
MKNLEVKTLMKNTFCGIPTLLIALIILGCTPGRAQTKQAGDYAGAESSVDDYNFEDSDTSSTMKQQTLRDNTNQEAAYTETGPRNAQEYTGSEKFYQKGLASWYGREFQGKTTASGERFNMNEFSAAHKELPFGTLVDIKNIKTGRVVRVKVNDRGPYRDNRIVDLSYAAANELGFIRDGETMVGISIIKWGDGARKNTGSADISEKTHVEPAVNDYDNDDDVRYTPRAKSGKSLQAGAFYSQQNADQFKKKLEGITHKPVVVVKNDDMYKVRVGGLSDQNDINMVKRMLEDENISSFIVAE